MNFTNFINERYINLFMKDVDERNKYKDEVYDQPYHVYKSLNDQPGELIFYIYIY